MQTGIYHNSSIGRSDTTSSNHTHYLYLEQVNQQTWQWTKYHVTQMRKIQTSLVNSFASTQLLAANKESDVAS